MTRRPPAARVRSRRKSARSGFTLIEIILTIVILGILSINALPGFLNLTDQAHTASRNDVAASVQTGIQHFRLQDIVTNGPPGVYPGTLDTVANGGTCTAGTPCFTAAIINGVSDQRWHKTNNTQYTYNAPTQVFTFIYNPATGQFAQ